MKDRIAIVDGIRSPMCKAGTALSRVPADDLGTVVARELLARVDVDPKAIDEVIFGCVSQPPGAQNVARVIALKAGVPKRVPAFTVHRNCASGAEALSTAAAKIRAGDIQVALVGGTESMSNMPLYYGPAMTGLFTALMRARTLAERLRQLIRFRPHFLKPVIGVKVGLTDPVCGLPMGVTAEILAKEFHVSRREQDEFALLSHRRAAAAQAAGILAEEIVPLPVAPDYDRLQLDDNGPRPEQSMEALAKLRPYFDRRNGTVTVGNACPLTDGAAALLVMSEQRAKDFGCTPLGWLRGSAYVGLDPERMGMGPVYATAKLLAATGLSLADIDLIELNEAFAAQVIANERAFASDSFAKDELGRGSRVGEVDRERLNVNGGAIALGHPVGMTGARLVLTVLKALRRRNCNLGLATMCIGGGQGGALLLEAT